MSEGDDNHVDVDIPENWLWTEFREGQKSDRRSFKRVAANIPAQIILTDGPEAITVETVNVSASGVYCSVPRYIPPDTTLRMTLILPRVEDGKIENRLIDFRAVTVRTDHEKEEWQVHPYRVAVQFEDVPEEQQRELDQFVRQRLGMRVSDNRKWVNLLKGRITEKDQ